MNIIHTQETYGLTQNCNEYRYMYFRKGAEVYACRLQYIQISLAHIPTFNLYSSYPILPIKIFLLFFFINSAIY